MNIVEYIEDENQDELMETIGMVETYNGLISQIKNEGINYGITEGKKEVILELLETFSIDVVAELLHREKSEIEEIIKD